MKVPVVIQMQPGENGAAALCMILGYYKRFVSLSEMREKCVQSRNGVSPEQIIRTANEYGLDGHITVTDITGLKKECFPVMVIWKKKYYAIVRSIRHNIVSITDPAKGEYRMTVEKFLTLYSGKAIFFEKNAAFRTAGKRESLFSLISDRVMRLKKTFAALTALTLICVGLNLAMANLSRVILDSHLGPGRSEEENAAGFTVLCLYLLFILLYAVSGILKTRLMNKASRNASAVSGSRLFKNMTGQPMRFFELYSTGELISRFDSNVTLDNSIIRILVPRTIDAVMTVIYIVALFRYNSVIAAVCLSLVLVNIAVTLLVQERNAIAYRSMATSTGTVNTSLLNGMNMIETIRSTGAERSFYNMWYDSQTKFNENKMTSAQIKSVSLFLSQVHRSTLQGVQLFMGAFFILKGNFTLGTLSLFQSVLNNMISSMENCITAVDSLQKMRTNIERVNDINKREIRESIPLSEKGCVPVDKLSGQLTAKHIFFRYNPADKPAINDVSLTVEPGQMIAIVGGSGSGKSTLLKILADLYEPESGEILYAGLQRNEIPDVIFRSSVTTVDQETVMFEDSVYNNIRMWDNTIENYEVIMAARDAQIHARIIQERLKYTAPIKENGRNFSGGELQRLELARALAHEPTLLMLDEFTSALDALTEDRVIRSIKDKGTTCIIVAHRLSTIVDCDRIYVMDQGRIIQEGTHQELYDQEGLYRDLISSRQELR